LGFPNGLRNHLEKLEELFSSPEARPPAGVKLAAITRLRMVRRIAWILPENGSLPPDKNPSDGASFTVCSDRSDALAILRRS
jgi:hypothetical protein